MTRIFLFIGFPIFMLNSCKDSMDDKMRAFLPGSYVSHSMSEFSIADDTINIEKQGGEDNQFLIIRTVSFRRIKEGKIQPAEFKKEQWVCTNDEKEKVLKESKKGLMLTAVPEKSIVYVGSTPYQKLTR